MFCNTSSFVFFSPLTFKILIRKDTLNLSAGLRVHFTAGLSLPGSQTSSDYRCPEEKIVITA